MKRRRVRTRAEETGQKEEYDELKRREDTINKETDSTLLYLSSLPSLSLAFPSIIKKIGALSPLQEAPLPLFC